MSLHRPDSAPPPSLRTEGTLFGAVYLALVTLPLVDIVAPDLASQAGRLVGRVPVLDLLGRQWVWIVLAMVLVGLVYATLRRTRVGVAPPRPGSWASLGWGLGATLTTYLILLVLVVVLGKPLSDVAHVAFFPDPSVGFLWWNVVVPGLLGGLAYGVLFTGAIQSDLRNHVGSHPTVLVIATIAGLYHWLIDPITTLARSNLLLVLALVPIVGTGYAVVSVSQIESETSLRATLTPRRLVALALAGFVGFLLLVDVFSGRLTPAEIAFSATWGVVFGVAAIARERTGSLWAGALVVGTFWTAIRLTPYLAAAVGLGPPR